MKITYIGHACFAIEKDGYKIVIDPYEDGSVPGYNNVREEADMVLCTHQHFDHNAASLVELRDGGSCPFTITKIESYHDECRGEKRGPNTIYIFDDGVSKAAHLGDIGCDINVDMTEEERAMISNLDAVMFPIGGTYTIDANQAFALIQQIDPKIAIPMHFKSVYYELGLGNIGTEDAFMAKYDVAARLAKSSIDIEKAPLVQVNVLKPQNAVKQN